MTNQPFAGARERGSRGRAVGALLVASVAHLALALIEVDEPPPPLVAVTEVELAPPEPPAPEPPALPPEPVPPVAAAAPVRRATPSKRPSAAPQAAPAPAVRTVEESAPTSEAPVRFVSDPNGSAFGLGNVALGGTGTGAGQGSAPASPSLARGAPTASAPELSRPPRLAESDPCRGFFPARAGVDRGQVELRVRIERDGSVRAVTVALEAPLGHGFGFAARDCLFSKRFTPALDRAGRAVAVSSPVSVRFSR